MSGPFVSRAGADGVIARAITRLRHTLAAAASRVRESSPDSSDGGGVKNTSSVSTGGMWYC